MSEPKTAVELKPCPFCGSRDVRVMYEDDAKTLWTGTCRNCDAEGPYADTESAAAEKWNGRYLIMG